MQRLAVFGWDDALAGLLAALRQRASLRAVAVGDQSAAQLVRARSATALPCYQHLMEMARIGEYDAALIHTPAPAADIATQAAARGADLLLTGDRMDAETLGAVAATAARHGVALVVLRPLLRAAGCVFLNGLIASEREWRPRFASLEVRGDREASALLRDAVAAALALTGRLPEAVSASATHFDGGDSPDAVAAHLRFVDGAVISLIARPAPATRLLCSLAAPAGTVEVDGDEGETEVTIATGAAAPERSRFSAADALAVEAARVARVLGGRAIDATQVQREAATLLACEAALASGQTRAVSPPTTRAALRLVEGGAAPERTPRAGRLQLVRT